MEIIGKTRKASSAIRSAERGWDWCSYSTKDGVFVEALQVDPEEAKREANDLMLELLYLSQEESRSNRRR